MVQICMLSDEMLLRYTPLEKLLTQNFDANSTRRKEVRTNERTNIRTDERKDENYIHLGINAWGIKTSDGSRGLSYIVLAVSSFSI